MLDILETVVAWREAGLGVAIATLVDVERSAPRRAGSTLAVNERGEVAGSISGGCVEADVYEIARGCIGGSPARMVEYGISDAAATAYGLTCGGTLYVFVRALSAEDDLTFARISSAVSASRPVAFAIRLDAHHAGASFVVDGRSRAGSLRSARLDAVVGDEMFASLGTPCSVIRSFGKDGETLRDGARVFVAQFAPKPDMFIFGAVDFSRAMATVGRFLGYRVSVVDARPVFATAARIPDADRIEVAWPDEFLARATVSEATAIIVLTHDMKFDVPLLRVALESNAGYIGVMGSRQTQRNRIAELREKGVGEAALARLHGPIGLDIGAHTPEETAISIASEIVAARNGRAGGYLRDGVAPLHGPVSAGALRSA